jgi:hypothetical protein
VLDAIHEFGKGENRYLMSVGETKGRQVEELVRSKKPKVRRIFGSVKGGEELGAEALSICSLSLSLGHMWDTRESPSLE